MMNKLTTIGNLVSDPQIREFNGSTVCSFRMASTTRRKDESGGYVSNFYNVDVWRALGENCAKYLHKGDRVSVVGDLVMRGYTDTKGQQRYSLDVTATDVVFLMERNSDAKPTSSEPYRSKQTAKAGYNTKKTPPVVEEEDDEPLPF